MRQALIVGLLAGTALLATCTNRVETGQSSYDSLCAGCHGTYGKSPEWPAEVVPLEDVGTDPVRLTALSVEHRRNYGNSWLAHYGEHAVVESPRGYVAPPLDGIWASAPYLHNGSVPTLWHLLHPDQRPEIWRRAAHDLSGYDHEKVGLIAEHVSAVPKHLADPAERRHFFDTRQPGKSAAGHDYPSALSDAEREAVLEYLKTL